MPKFKKKPVVIEAEQWPAARDQNMTDTSELTPTMRLRFVDKAMSNVSVKMILQQFWAYPIGSDPAGLWRDVEFAGHCLEAPTETLS